jgi:type II secretory pathway component PulM
MDVFKQAWQRWTPQERIIVSILAGCTLLVGLLFGAIMPVIESRAEAKTRLEGARLTASMVDQLVTQTPQQGAMSLGAVDLRSILIQLADQRGLSISRVEPSDEGRLNVVFDQVSGPALFDWLNACVEAGLGEPDRLSLRATEVPGRISANVSFRGGAPS